MQIKLRIVRNIHVRCRSCALFSSYCTFSHATSKRSGSLQQDVMLFVVTQHELLSARHKVFLLQSRWDSPPSLSLRSCSCPGLERIWEADLEACHLFLRGLQLRAASCGGVDVEEPSSPSGPCYLPDQPPAKEDEDEEEDCAMLTALGGRWCPEANLQNSEFTKVARQCCQPHINDS